MRCPCSAAQRGPQIVDFLSDGDAESERLLHTPTLIDASIRASLVALREGSAVSGEVCRELARLGLTTENGRLSAQGDHLAYHLAEFDRQRHEKPFGGWAEQSGLGPCSRVLDIGCGAGQTLRLLSAFEPAERVGVDLDLNSLACGCLLDEADDRAIRYLCASAHALPIPDGRFSHVICRVGLNYMHQRRALGEIVRVLQPGGSLYCRLEGPGFDLRLIQGAHSLRERLSRALDLFIGAVHSTTGLQRAPGARFSGGRSFASIGRVSKILVASACAVVDKAILAHGPVGLPTGFELLAKKRS